MSRCDGEGAGYSERLRDRNSDVEPIEHVGAPHLVSTMEDNVDLEVGKDAAGRADRTLDDNEENKLEMTLSWTSSYLGEYARSY